jgi:tetratricopeptide (TPR) repeat protein
MDDLKGSARLDQLRAMLRDEPKDVFLHYAIMLELRKLNDHPEALLQGYELLEIDPGYVPAHYQMALLLHELGQPADALARCESGLRLATAQRDLKAAREFNELRQQFIGEE